MALSPGTRLGPYELGALIGTGGMGHVYRARDTRLDRTVAIKVLSANPAEHEQQRERFDREARAVSSLNHPHICTLHDIGRAEGIDFLVMEFLDGETLASRLTRGALPPDQAIRVAVEIADGLARAHAAGIVHRDLKPANIMLTKAGVKLLDFGIAKQGAAGVGSAPDFVSALQTLPQGLTAEGTILGTVQYMAPEQLEGKPLDARTDIFAFGAVLYEMIAGTPAFHGDSQASLIAAIFHSTPTALATIQPLTPAALDRLAMACLAKQVDERWQSTQDLLRELRWLRDGGSPTTTAGLLTQPVAHSRTRQRVALIAAAGLVAGALLGGAAVGWFRRPVTAGVGSPIGRFALALPPGSALATIDNQSAGAALDLSPDGAKLVYVVQQADRQQLMLRAIDQIEPAPMPGTEGASAPFFSPDGEWVAFFADGKLKKVAVSGGVPLLVARVPPVPRGGTWSADGTIFLTPTFADSIYKVAAGGGTIAPATSLGDGESNHLLPHVLPGSKAMVFTAWKGGSFADSSVWMWVAATGEQRKLIDSATHARYAKTGHLIFSRGNALLAVPFDLARLEVTGEPMPVADGVLFNPTNGTAEFALSETGTLAYAAVPATTTGTNIVWVDREGREERVADIPSLLERPRLSPDGRRIAVENLNDLWVYELATGGFRRVTFQGVNQYPVWSPDGKRLAFNRAAAGKQPGLFWTSSDGSGQPEAMTSDGTVQFPNDWSPDGRVLAFAQVAGTSNTNWDILVWPPDRKPVFVVNGPFKEFAPAFSPDGRWLAYVSEESGRREVHARPYPGPGTVAQITSIGADQPRWGRDGTELFFYHGEEFMRAQVQTTPELSASRPTVLFAGSYRHRFDEPGYPSYDVSPDGRRFLMLKSSNPGAAPARLNIVFNWFEELKRRTRSNLKPPL